MAKPKKRKAKRVTGPSSRAIDKILASPPAKTADERRQAERAVAEFVRGKHEDTALMMRVSAWARRNSMADLQDSIL